MVEAFILSGFEECFGRRGQCCPRPGFTGYTGQLGSFKVKVMQSVRISIQEAACLTIAWPTETLRTDRAAGIVRVVLHEGTRGGWQADL